MAVSFGCPLVGTLSELNDKVLKVGQRAYAIDGIGTKWKTGDGIQTFSALNWDKNEGGDSDIDLSNYYTKEEVDKSLAYKQDILNMFTDEYLTDGFIELLGEYYYPNLIALKGYVKDKLDDYFTKEEIDNSLVRKQSISNMFGGNLNDLTDDFIELAGKELYPNLIALKCYVNDELSSYQTKTDFPDSPTPDDEGKIIFNFSDMYNKELRLYTAPYITIKFPDNEYAHDYIAGLCFDSGETPTSISYSSSGIINWVGTDCSVDTETDESGKVIEVSVFEPSPNTHYDIVFYFNGVQFIGLVNGFVPAKVNRESGVSE